MKWKTYLMGGAANERMERMGQSAHLSHACEVLPGGALRPLCSVKLTSLCIDDSLTAEGELPDCPTCKRVLLDHRNKCDVVFALRTGLWKVCLEGEILPADWPDRGTALAGLATERNRKSRYNHNAHPHGRWTPTKK
jgi:hypothetical protein